MNEPLNREVAILNEALELPMEQRASYLNKACAGDDALRRQVQELLRANEEAADFLNGPAGLNKSPHVSPTEKPGDHIGRYKLLQQIGEGGCGVVYMAEQTEPVRRRVALKIIKLGMDTKQVIARFDAERQALALMDHPNIAKVLDAGATETGRPYFVMELVRGIKITEFCDGHKIRTEDRLKLFIQVCQAIQHAHQKSVIHRDIKPSNILVSVNDGVPVPKVIDFGIAKATQGRLTDQTLFTAFEQFIGTPAYMSPEQAVMTSLDVDTRSDIYSLGVLLYELITGRTPFDQKELLAAGLDEMRRTIRETEPPKPSTRLRTLLAADLTTTASCRQIEPPRLIHSVRGDLDWIVMKALEKDRTRRYETANGLAKDVQRHLNHEPVSARPPSNLYRLQKLAQRNRLTFAAAAAGVVAIVLGLIVLGVGNVRITRERNQKDAALQQKDSALTAAHMSEQRAKEELFMSLRSQAQARRYSRQMGQRLDSLAALSEAARIRPDPALRDEAIAAMGLLDVRRGPQWLASRTNLIGLVCDSMYRQYALLDRHGILTVRNIADGQEIQRFDTGQGNAYKSSVLSFSPDGRFVAMAREGEPPQAWLIESGESILQNAPRHARTLAFSADSRLIAVAESDLLHCFDLATGRTQQSWRTAGRIQSMQFNPRGSQIAVGYRDQTHVSVYDLPGGAESRQLSIGATRATVCWHPDGRQLAVGSADARIQIWDVDGQRRVAALEGHAQDVDFLTFHPSAGLLASGSWDAVLRLWDTATGRQAMQIPLSANLRFSKDGRWLGFFAVSDEQLQLLEFVPSQEYFTLESNPTAHRTAPYFCATSPEGRLLAVSMDDGVRLWDLPSRREVALVPSGFSQSVVFEPDGGALWTCAAATGLQRWPIRMSEANVAELLLGPPERLNLPFAPDRIAGDATGRTLAVLSETSGKALILDITTRSALGGPLDHPMVAFLALSPNGKWLATSGWHSDRVRLWNTENGEQVREWTLAMMTRVSFTPDSRQLVIGRASEFNFVDVTTLETTRKLPRAVGLYPGHACASPDGKLMAMEMAPGVIHLKEISTTRTVAQLEDPYGDRSSWMTFTPDGTKLIVLVTTYAGALHVWDLRAVRARLKTMGLDWDWPEFPPARDAVGPGRGRALKVEVLSAEAR